LNVSNNLYIGSVDAPITGILFNNNGSDQMYILANGNVGIGTIAPTTKLHIFATQSYTGFRLVDTSQGLDKILTSDVSGNSSWTTASTILSSINGVTGSGTINHFPYWKSSNNLSSTSPLQISGNNLIVATGSGIIWNDVAGVTPTSTSNRIRWSFTNDYAEIYAWQPSPNLTDFVFKMADDALNAGNEEFIFWMVGQSEAEAQYPLKMNSGEFTVNALRKYGTTTPTQTSGSVDFVVLNANASTSTGNDVLLFGDTNLGRVSIGHKSPMAKLHITSTQSNVPLIIASGSTTTDLVRITQNGTGNSFVVEDSSNPDSTPFVIDNVGNVAIGTATNSYAKLIIMDTNNVVYSSTASYGLSDNTNNGVVTTIYNTSQTTGSYAGIKFITRNTEAKKWGIYNVSKGAISADLTFGHGNGDVIGSEVMRLTDGNNVGIGLTAINARLHVKANTGLTGSTVFKVDGNVGELFTVTDSLTGSLMSVNDISGLPILEVFDDNTILMGDYQAPILYSSTKSVVGIVTNFVVYQFVASLYTSVSFEYNVQNSTNLRAGTITGVWNSATILFTEISTTDIGSTTPITFDVVLTTISTVVYVQLRATTTTSGWTIKSIIRSI
jgi:hypothetical protein